MIETSDMLKKCTMQFDSNDLTVWPTYDSGQFAHSYLYMHASDLLVLLFNKIFFNSIFIMENYGNIEMMFENIY